MSPQPPESTATCGECTAPLHADQRYCLRCGARHGAPRVDPLGALGFAMEAETRLPGAATATGSAFAGGATAATDTGAVAGDTRVAADAGRRAPSRRLSAALAAATLALGVAAGAALGPGPAPSVAAAPQRLVALVVPSAAPAPATTTAEDKPSPPDDQGSSDTPSTDDDTATNTPDDASSASDDRSSADDSSSTDDSKTTTTRDGDSTTTGADETTTKTTAATVPAHVFVISLTQLDATAFAPTSPLADLVAQGTLLSDYAAAGPSAAANELALLGGQVPTADCAADLAACILPAGETSLPDQLLTNNLRWRAYVEDPAQRCATTPSARVGVSLFTTLATRKDCATNVVDPATLDADLAEKSKTPALSLFVPDACHDGSATPCAEGAPAGLDGATTPLHALVAKITAGAAYKADGVLLIVSDALPPPSPDPATAAATPPGPLGALVLSPRATAARTVDTASGPVALLASIDALLGLDPLGTAAQVTTPALDGVLAPPVASASSTFPHRSHPTNPTRRSP